MDIRLVTTSFNDEVHGTFNDKKTGCGINLLKSENVTRFRRGGIMTDLGEITCDKCKAKIAKEMIRSDQKEMKALLKEEKLRAKKGIEDEGIVPLGNTTAKPTKVRPVEAPKPVTVKPTPVKQAQPEAPVKTIPGTGVAIDNDLAQFSIEKPPVEETPEKSAAQQAEDFLAQFAVNKPDEAPEEAVQDDYITPTPQPDDFLAQFAVNKPEEPAQPAFQQPVPPVVDDVDAALNAMQNNLGFQQPAPAANPYAQPAPAPVQPAPVQPASVQSPPITDNDILNMFSIDKTEQNSAPAANPYVQPAPAPVQPAPVQQPAGANNGNVSEWDLIANQLFGQEAPAQPAAQPAPQPVVNEIPAPQPAGIAPAQYQANAPILDDISAAINSVQQNIPAPAPVQSVPQAAEIAPAQYQANAPILDDISAAINSVQQNIPAPAPVQPVPQAAEIAPAQYQANAPVLDDISAALNSMQQNAPAPAQPAPQPAGIAPAQYQANAPVLDDISAALNSMQQNAPAPVQPAPAPVPVLEEAPVIDDIEAAMAAAQQNAPIQPAPVQEEAPVIDDIDAAMAAFQQNVPKSVAPAQSQPDPIFEQPPVIDDISAAMAAVQQNVPKSVAPVQSTPINIPAAPKPARPVQPAQPAAIDPSQIISVPQITGYDAANQPIYTYVQMQITGHDANGQPILAPIPGQEIPTFQGTYNKNTRLQEAIKAAQEVPTSSKDMTPGQRIAAAEAAKGNHPSANVSKIATNPHSRSTSQAFINAISESKEYANQSLTDTQGLQQRTRVIGSIEDVLSQLGDNSLKQQKAAEAKAQVNVPKFEEYKAPTSRPASSRPSAPAPRKPSMPDRPLTKAEQKALKKQEKIDAKFKKEMAKRGF